jgi:hypothetical protein
VQQRCRAGETGTGGERMREREAGWAGESGGSGRPLHAGAANAARAALEQEVGGAGGGWDGSTRLARGCSCVRQCAAAVPGGEEGTAGGLECAIAIAVFQSERAGDRKLLNFNLPHYREKKFLLQFKQLVLRPSVRRAPCGLSIFG